MSSYYSMASKGLSALGQARNAFGQAHSAIKANIPPNMQQHYTNFTNSAAQLGSIASNCVGQNKLAIAGHLQNMGNAFVGVAKIGMQQAQNGMQQQYPQQQQQQYPQQQQQQQYRQGGKLRRHKKTKKNKRRKGSKTRRTRRRH